MKETRETEKKTDRLKFDHIHHCYSMGVKCVHDRICGERKKEGKKKKKNVCGKPTQSK